MSPPESRIPPPSPPDARVEAPLDARSGRQPQVLDQTLSPGTPRRSQRRSIDVLSEKGIEFLIRLCGISAIIFVFAIFFFVFREGAPMLSKLDLQKFVFTPYWYPTSLAQPRYGVGALIIGTLSVTVLAMVIAVPFGLGAAIFVSEFCGRKTKEVLKVTIELLAAEKSA